MIYSVKVGEHTLGMLDKVDIHRSVELLADTATITLPASEYNKRLSIEQELKRGDKVSIALGYEETGLVDEFVGYLQRISTDKGSITLYCEDDLYAFRKPVANEVLKKISLRKLLEKLCKTIGADYKVVCSYEWTYDKFTIHNATAFDVLTSTLTGRPSTCPPLGKSSAKRGCMILRSTSKKPTSATSEPRTRRYRWS